MWPGPFYFLPHLCAFQKADARLDRGHGLTSRPREKGDSAVIERTFMGFLWYPNGAVADPAVGSLQLQYCSTPFFQTSSSLGVIVHSGVVSEVGEDAAIPSPGS